MSRGLFITFEGIEGSGKSTQIQYACDFLKQQKKKVLFLREPGGVKISEKIRKILLDVASREMGQECETLLYMAARAQLVQEVLAPALNKGTIVLCDRFLDSTIAYQGYGHGVDIALINKIGLFATKGITADLTFIFDVEVKEGLSRIRRAKDRIERRALSYHNRVRQGYLDLARKNPKRVKLIAGNKSKEEIQKIVRGHMQELFDNRNSPPLVGGE